MQYTISEKMELEPQQWYVMLPDINPLCCLEFALRQTSHVLMQVRNTVDTGRTVTCTIHQPSIDIFEVRNHTDFTCLFLQ